MKSGRRKMLAAREDLVDKASKIAKSKGFTLFGMINNLLELSISAEIMGITLEEAVDNYSTIRAIKNASFTLVLESLLYDTADIAYQRAKEKSLKTWFEAGVWVGKHYISKGTGDQFATLINDLKAFSWNAPDFILEMRGTEISLRVLSPRFSDSYTLLLNRFLEGILEAFAYAVTFSEVGKGTIRMEAVKKEA
jgi:hypothetical protein